MRFLVDDVLKHVAVTLDGAEVLYCRMDIFREDPDVVSFGKDPAGEAPFAREFSGSIVPLD
jgi:hypothetical protein